jgi:predicted RNase H-like HicB family nuclease
MERTIKVSAEWDSEAKVWVAESEDVPGLATEAESPDALLEKLKILIPELLELNDSLFKEYKSLDLLIQYHGQDRTTLPVAA